MIRACYSLTLFPARFWVLDADEACKYEGVVDSYQLPGKSYIGCGCRQLRCVGWRSFGECGHERGLSHKTGHAFLCD